MTELIACILLQAGAVALFLALTSPLAAHALARAAYRSRNPRLHATIDRADADDAEPP